MNAKIDIFGSMPQAHGRRKLHLSDVMIWLTGRWQTFLFPCSDGFVDEVTALQGSSVARMEYGNGRLGDSSRRQAG